VTNDLRKRTIWNFICLIFGHSAGDRWTKPGDRFFSSQVLNGDVRVLRMGVHNGDVRVIRQLQAGLLQLRGGLLELKKQFNGLMVLTREYHE